MNPDLSGRRSIRVCCVCCGAFLFALAGDYVQAGGICLTCTYRISGAVNGQASPDSSRAGAAA